MITVFYDGSCHACAKEIKYYQKKSSHLLFDWQDISAPDFNIEQEKFTLLNAFKKLHVKNHDNKIHIGVDAFVLIWSNIPMFKPLGWIASLPVIKQTLSAFYELFVKYRVQKINNCTLFKNDIL